GHSAYAAESIDCNFHTYYNYVKKD
ncbi:MAG: hypothetical protein JWM28_1599, partial [Chitinophagaceae bacterium]|nr:hypothetical protein [Chitinophagaceae bacterium]